MLNKMFEQLATRCPLPAMVRTLLENVFSAQQVNTLFEDQAEKQYTKELLFSTVVELMTQLLR